MKHFLKKARCLWLPTVMLLLLAACGKDKSITDPKDDEPDPVTGVKTGVYEQVNLAADINATSAQDAKTLYFSLEENKVIDESQKFTTKWDIAFGGIYNSSILINNGKSSISPGYGGAGIGAVYLVVDRKFDAQYYDTTNFYVKTLPIPVHLFDASFNAVKTAPDDSKMKTHALISLDHFQSTDDGWAYYDFYGMLFPGNPKKSHVVYTMPRTFVVKTAKGKYAKICIQSIYKDKPENPDRDSKPGYLTFKYAIQKDGSKNLDIQP
ncbi:MAG: HmuY family protein [Niabella sp.]